jgi:translation initiation factor IF-3
MQIRRRKPSKKKFSNEKRTRVNEMIRIPEVNLINENGENVGVVSTKEALARAKEAELDLIEVNPKVTPSICKIGDYGKIKYEKEKLEHKKKVANKKSELKGIRLSFKIKGGDLETRINQAKKFLEAGNQVKIEMILKGREKAMSKNARESIQEFINGLGEVKIVQQIQKQGGKFSAIVAPEQ